MQVVNLTRLRRPSFSESHGKQAPYMTDNLLYDMDSTTSPSSSDSDSSPADRCQSTVPERPKIPPQNFDSDSTTSQKSAPAKASSSTARTKDWHSKSRSESPLTEISLNRRSDTIPSSRQRQLSADGESKKSRRQTLSGKKDSTPQKRWV